MLPLLNFLKLTGQETDLSNRNTVLKGKPFEYFN